MIGNIKLQHAITQNETRQAKQVASTAKGAAEQKSGDHYSASLLASVVKDKLESIGEDTQLEKVVLMKNLIQHGEYEVDLDKLAEKLVADSKIAN